MDIAFPRYIICLMGPTASGKTHLAIELLKYFPFEIISVDSAMVYCGMDIGTAKPDAHLLSQAPHRLINLCGPNDIYSAAQFRKDALHEIEAIYAKNKIPLLVGGTMLYFRALQKGLADMPSADPSLREQLNFEGQEQGWPALHRRLITVDPIAANRIHPHDGQRIQRALEVYYLTGKNLTAWQQDENKNESRFYDINIGITPSDRSILHARIADRFLTMIKQGFIEEVKELLAKGYTADLPAMRSVGYRQVIEHLEGKYQYDVMCEKSIIATRQLAKRQLTWLRSWPNLTWFNSENPFLTQNVVNHLREKIIGVR